MAQTINSIDWDDIPSEQCSLRSICLHAALLSLLIFSRLEKGGGHCDVLLMIDLNELAIMHVIA